MRRHTPGPWHLDSVNRIRSARGVHIGEVATSWTHGYMDPAETVANGKVMSASPDLVDALLAILDEVRIARGPDGAGYGHACNVVEVVALAALTKAGVVP